jgi:hypothetical protein
MVVDQFECSEPFGTVFETSLVGPSISRTPLAVPQAQRCHSSPKVYGDTRLNGWRCSGASDGTKLCQRANGKRNNLNTVFGYALVGSVITCRRSRYNMSAVERYQNLIEEGLIIPNPESPARFKFPSLLVHVPSITTSHVIDPETRKRVADNAELERNPQRNQW